MVGMLVVAGALDGNQPLLGSDPPSAVGVSGQLTVTSRVEGIAGAESLKWHETLDSGWQESKRTGRPMLIFITSESCTYCDAMKKTTLCNDSVRKKLIDRFVPIQLKPDANGGVLSRVKIPAYPTTLVARPHGKVIAHRIGYQPPKEFCDLLNNVAMAEPSVNPVR